jgi:hypothetical protein
MDVHCNQRLSLVISHEDCCCCCILCIPNLLRELWPNGHLGALVKVDIKKLNVYLNYFM